MFEYKQKVVYVPADPYAPWEIYDFGYYTEQGKTAIVYEQGECNMQDATAVDVRRLRPIGGMENE